MKASDRVRAGANRPLSSSAHPLATGWWWVALGVLVANDHLLKGAELVPGWFTGKLSDFCGLLVAPPLLAALVFAKRRPTRALAFLLVAAVFTAINVSEFAASAVEQGMGALGFPWRIWSDPTDLVALVVVPVAWWLAYGAPARRARERAGAPIPSTRLARGVSCVGAIAGGIACLATSPDDTIRSAGTLVNSTPFRQDVRVYRVSGFTGCDPHTWSVPAADDIDLESCKSLDFEQATSLGWYRYGEEPPECDAVVVAVDGLPNTLLVWSAKGQSGYDGYNNDPDRAPLEADTVYLESAGRRLYLEGSERISASAFDWELPNTLCSNASAERGYD